MSDIRVQSITFGDEHIEVSYMEERDATAKAVMIRTLIVDVNAVRVQLEELMESAQDLVDEALLVMRNPPKKIRAWDMDKEEDIQVEGRDE